MFDIRGQYAISVGIVVALLITISIGALVLYSVTGAIETEPGSYAENAIHNVEEKGGTAFNLMTILAIVVVAATIISVVVRATGGFGGGRREAPPASETIHKSYLTQPCRVGAI